MIKYEKLFVIANRAGKAFVVPYDTTSAGKKRIETAERWARGYAYGQVQPLDKPGKIVDNTSKNNYIFDTFADRYRTDNKFVVLLDPTGLQVEVSIANVVELIKETTISCGTILDHLVWLRDGANNWLVSETSPRLTGLVDIPATGKDPAKSRLSHSPGDIIENTLGKYVYLGKRFVRVYHPEHTAELYVNPFSDRMVTYVYRERQMRYTYVTHPDQPIVLISTRVAKHVYGSLYEGKINGCEELKGKKACSVVHGKYKGQYDKVIVDRSYDPEHKGPMSGTAYLASEHMEVTNSDFDESFFKDGSYYK